MFRRFRRIVALAVVAAFVVGVALTVSTRSDLTSARDVVESRWADVRPGLDSRYRLLAGAGEAVAKAPGPKRSLATDIATAWDDWQSGGSAGREIGIANDLEGLGRRLLTLVTASPSIRTEAVQQALTAYLQTPIPGRAEQLNEAISRYDDERTGALRSLVTGPLGFDPIRVLDLTGVPGTNESKTTRDTSSTTAA